MIREMERTKDEEIGTHDFTGDAMIFVLEGVGEFTVDGMKHEVHPGESLAMPEKNHIPYIQRNHLNGFLLLFFQKINKYPLLKQWKLK